MKKIAFVTHIYTDSNFHSGGVKLNYILLNGLKKCNYTIDLYCNNVRNNVHNLFENIYKFDEIENNRANYDLILSDKACVPSDITYIHDHSYPFRVKMLFSKFKFNLYKIFKEKRHNKRLSEFNITKNNLKNTKIVVVSSNILKQDMIDNYDVDEHRIIVIPPPIEEYGLQHSKSKKEVPFIFGLCAVGFERKGGYIALKAIKNLKYYNKNFKVKIIYPSDNFFVKLLLKLYGIEKYCEFLGFYNDMSKFYNSIDCLIMPSLLEPYGMVTTEALSCGVPAIVPNHCGACDCIENAYNGYVYDAKNKPVDSLVDAMKNMLELGNTEYLELSKNSLKTSKSFTSDSFVQRYLKLMEENIKV